MFISLVVGWNPVHGLEDKRTIFTNTVYLTWTQHVLLPPCVYNNWSDCGKNIVASNELPVA